MKFYISYWRECSTEVYPCSIPVLFLALVIFLFYPAAPKAQQMADSLILGPLQVQATRISLPVERQPIFVNQLDSTLLQQASIQSLADLLTQYSTLNVKDYGPGGAATVSQRGMEADQTQVLWNGMPLNVPFLGLVDFALLESEMFSGVEVAPGNMSSSYGGRSMGGSISLNTTIPEEKISLSQSLGSYGYDRTMFKAGYKNKPWKGGVVVRRHRSDNDYSYVDPFTGQTKARSNNQVHNRQFMTGIGWDKEGVAKVESMLWFNETDHQIPGPIVAGTGTAKQYDKSVRWLNAITTRVLGWELQGRGYFSSYELDYIDKQSNINSQTFSKRTRMQAGLQKYWSNAFLMKWSASAGVTGIETNNYNGKKQREQISLQVNPIWEVSDVIYFYPAVRWDYYSDFGHAVSPSIGVNWKADNQLTVRLSGGYNFSPPTFNDLHWNPGGNPDLKPERSIKYEVGLNAGDESSWYGQHDISVYQLSLEQGIQWTQKGSVWSPENIKRMQSKGITWRSNKTVEAGKLDIKWTQIVDWTRSVIAETRFLDDETVGNQLAYVPEWTYRTNARFIYDNLYLGLHYRWTSGRYADNSHQSTLENYKKFDLSAGFHYNWGPVRWEGNLHLKNLTNEQYQVIQWYPMPGRHLRFSLTLHYNI